MGGTDDLLSNSRRRNWGLNRGCRCSAVAVDLGLGAVTGDVTSLATAVAGIASSVEWAAVGSGAVTGDVTQFSTGVAFHSLSLTISCEVVWSTALVAGGRTRATSKGAPSTKSTKSTKSTAGRATSSSSHASSRAGVRAVTGQMSGQATTIASSAGTSSAEAQSRAISLNVSEALTVIALLRFGSARMRASIGLVARLLAVIAKSLGRRAHLSVVSDISALEACAAR